jgi:hypothetical protein
MHPYPTHSLVDLQAAHQARSVELQRTAETTILVGRLTAMYRRFATLFVRPTYGAQPTMAWDAGPRTQPRDGRGRFLSKAWLREAETFTHRDIAWFRSAPEVK